MKGICRIYNSKTGKVWSYFSLEDVDTLSEYFEEFKASNKRFLRMRNHNDYVAEVVEETEDTNTRLAYYTWPQLSRVKYSDSCYEIPVDRKYTKMVKNVVDWAVETFPDGTFSFVIEACESKLVYLYVYRQGVLTEKYGFKSAHDPYERTIY